MRWFSAGTSRGLSSGLMNFRPQCRGEKSFFQPVPGVEQSRFLKTWREVSVKNVGPRLWWRSIVEAAGWCFRPREHLRSFATRTAGRDSTGRSTAKWCLEKPHLKCPARVVDRNGQRTIRGEFSSVPLVVRRPNRRIPQRLGGVLIACVNANLWTTVMPRV